ncbi:MAG: hypothetical protein R3254_02575 [Thiomicrorhabdus sp.]|nr:hypothetical protein [Thiomicrorhabdus sp.]
MKPLFSALLFSACLSTPWQMSAAFNNASKKHSDNSVYQLLNNLNQTLKSELNLQKQIGVNHLSTFRKNNQIIIQVNHDPKRTYRNLIQDIAQSAARVNGIKFQDSFTLDILASYCKAGLFYSIQAKGLNEDVIVQYEDLKGGNITLHRINRQLCTR